MAFGKMAYDSSRKATTPKPPCRPATAPLWAVWPAASVVKGGELLAKGAGRAAPALGGALQAYQGIKSGDTFDTISGGAKMAGAAMIATGFGPPSAPP